MPNPKRRHTRSRRDSRRANWKIKISNLSLCSKCGSPVLPHRVCKNCGFYGDNLVFVKKEKEKEKEKKEDQNINPGI